MIVKVGVINGVVSREALTEVRLPVMDWLFIESHLGNNMLSFPSIGTEVVTVRVAVNAEYSPTVGSAVERLPKDVGRSFGVKVRDAVPESRAVALLKVCTVID